MLDLFKNYSVSEIIIFVVILALAVKELINFIDWANSRISKRFDKRYEDKEAKDNFSDRLINHTNQIKQLLVNQDKMNMYINKTQEAINLLIESDRTDIKAWITKEHHYYCYQKGYIDDYSLDCLEKRYAIYKEENGNSFVSALMQEIRALPKVSSMNAEDSHRMMSEK